MIYELLDRDLSSVIERAQAKGEILPEDKIRSYIY